MKTIYLYSINLLLLFISGCKISGNLAASDLPVPETYRAVAATDTVNIAAIQWKDFFTNESLRVLIDSAIVHNYDMQTALKNIEAAQLIVKQSKLGYLPDARLQATGSINRPSDNSLNGLSLSQFLGKSYVEDYTLGITLNWEADIWGKIKNQQSKAMAGYLQTYEARKAIQTNLVAALATGYYNLLMLDEQVSIARKNLLLSDSILNIIKLQFNAGEVTALAVQQAGAQQLVAAQLIPQLEQAIAVSENGLSVLSGLTPAAIKRNGNIYVPVFPGSVAAGFPSSLLQNRPDVRTKEMALTIANANTGIAKANMYPSLNITAAGGINAFAVSNWFNIPASLFATATGAIAQPLFMRKQLKTQYKVSLADRDKAVIAFRQSILTAVGEVSDALVNLNKLKEQQAIAAVRVNTLEQATGNAQQLFKSGLANYIEVITAQANTLQAELQLAVLQKEQSGAVIELYRSLGGGWK